tara:strand:+ start:1110 stop:1244 length:135 start_codon:yes stop_codon:yes gene_type:complete
MTHNGLGYPSGGVWAADSADPVLRSKSGKQLSSCVRISWRLGRR